MNDDELMRAFFSSRLLASDRPIVPVEEPAPVSPVTPVAAEEGVISEGLPIASNDGGSFWYNSTHPEIDAHLEGRSRASMIASAKLMHRKAQECRTLLTLWRAMLERSKSE